MRDKQSFDDFIDDKAQRSLARCTVCGKDLWLNDAVIIDFADNYYCSKTCFVKEYPDILKRDYESGDIIPKVEELEEWQLDDEDITSQDGRITSMHTLVTEDYEEL